jgi:hypothetical protein
MRLKWKVVNLAIFAFVASAFTLSLHGSNHQEEPLLLWTELRSPIGSPYGACLELSPDRRLMWYSKITDPGMTIRKVRDDLTLSEIILDTNERRKERKEVELTRLWMTGNKLLVELAEGIEYDEIPLWETPESYASSHASSFKFVILDPYTGEETPYPVWGRPVAVYPHPDRDKVLIQYENSTILYSFPDARELAKVTVNYGRFIKWCPDKQQFWGMLVYDENLDRQKVCIIVTNIMKNQVKTLLANEWNNERYSIRLYGVVESWGLFNVGNLKIKDQYDPFLLEEEIAILAYKTNAKELVFINFSPDGVARERELSEKMLPEALKQLGECWLIDMLPNGNELLIRQGRHENGTISQKCWYWLWNMDSGELKRIGYFYELRVINWLSSKEAIIEMISMDKDKVFCDYGILRLP